MAYLLNKIDVLPRVSKKATLSFLEKRSRQINKNICQAANAKQKIDAINLEHKNSLLRSQEAAKNFDTII